MSDSHIHLDHLSEPEMLLAEARKAGVDAWVVPGVSPDGWPGLMATAEAFDGVYAAPGIHPQQVVSCNEQVFHELEQLLAHPKVVAIGEVGLDRLVDSPWQHQEDVFVRMIHMARKTGKPLIIHTRRSVERTLELLRVEGCGDVSGVFHAFSGSLEVAKKVIDLNFALGIGGVVTYATAKRLPQVVRMVPAESLLLETDAPYMTPEPYRGQENRPAWLSVVAAKVASLRDWSLEEAAMVTSANAARIFALPKESRPHGNS